MICSPIEKRELLEYFKIFDFSKCLQNKTILLTGSKGLIGEGIIKWILLQNELFGTNTQIIASTRFPETVPDYVGEEDNIVFIRFGLEKQFVQKTHIDYIIHAASPTGNTFHKAHPVESLRVIIDATERMLDICKTNEGCSMVFLSSEEVYGLPKSDKPIKEMYFAAIDSLASRSCYPLGKKTAELLSYTYSLEYGVDVKIIRPTVIQGLFQKYEEQRVVNEILRCVIEGKDLLMKSPGLTKKCMMYSLDAISAVFTVLFKGEKGKAYNASNPETFLTIRDLANHVFSVFNPRVKIVFQSQDNSVSLGYLPQRSLVQDISELVSLGWKPYASIDHIYDVDIKRFAKET
jgi:nucleoside-diphosphate-sugar epimerase